MTDPDLAQLVYLDSDFRITKNGHYVLCAVTGKKIPLADLRYWNVARQEAYASAEISLQREQEMK